MTIKAFNFNLSINSLSLSLYLILSLFPSVSLFFFASSLFFPLSLCLVLLPEGKTHEPWDSPKLPHTHTHTYPHTHTHTHTKCVSVCVNFMHWLSLCSFCIIFSFFLF